MRFHLTGLVVFVAFVLALAGGVGPLSLSSAAMVIFGWLRLSRSWSTWCVTGTGVFEVGLGLLGEQGSSAPRVRSPKPQPTLLIDG
jgi:hypothetical protein